ncbi:MAG: hypothetical protein JWN30_1719 [Bacilli bacterium]|nr:hypothetical protein [Bacilli bacterium]
MAEQETDVEFYYVDVDQSPDLPQRFGVSSIPTLVLIKEGKEVDRSVGAIPEPQVKRFAHS